MKKLFGKIAATMFGLFTVCAPICAGGVPTYSGTIYIHNKPVFYFGGSKGWKNEPGIAEEVPYGIVRAKDAKKEAEEGEGVIPIYTVSEISGGYGDMGKEQRGFWKTGEEKKEQYEFYQSSFVAVGEHRMQVCHGCVCTNEDGSQHIEKLKYLAEIREGERGNERIVYARNTDKKGNLIAGYDKVLFKISYFKSKVGVPDFLNDTKDKLYSGYFIKREDGSTVGKVKGIYLPLDIIVMLVLHGDIKI